MTAPSLPPARHEEIEHLLATPAGGVCDLVWREHVRFLLNENRNLRWALAERRENAP